MSLQKLSKPLVDNLAKWICICGEIALLQNQGTSKEVPFFK